MARHHGLRCIKLNDLAGTDIGAQMIHGGLGQPLLVQSRSFHLPTDAINVRNSAAIEQKKNAEQEVNEGEMKVVGYMIQLQGCDVDRLGLRG